MPSSLNSIAFFSNWGPISSAASRRGMSAARGTRSGSGGRANWRTSLTIRSRRSISLPMTTVSLRVGEELRERFAVRIDQLVAQTEQAAGFLLDFTERRQSAIIGRVLHRLLQEVGGGGKVVVISRVDLVKNFSFLVGGQMGSLDVD